MGAMETVLEIEGLNKSFADNRAVRDLSFTVKKGEVFGLIGPDGAGKTTAMRMIAGLVRPDMGKIRLLGHTLPGAERSIRGLMGYMPQRFSLYGDLSVQENFRFFAGMYGVSKKDLPAREKRLLEIARLDRFTDRLAGALSGGMYKKLALACALVHNPAFLLLDEPTNGIDPISRRELWAFLGELVREGVTVVVSTPYMDEAERFDRVGLLISGHLAAQGAPRTMGEQFGRTVFEIEATPQLEARRLLKGIPHVDGVYTVGKKLHMVSSRGVDVGEELRRLLAASGVTVSRIVPCPPSFEDIFLHFSAAVSSEEEG